MYGSPVGSVNISTSGYLVNRTNVTTGIVVNTPTRIFNMHLISTSTASVITISNGQNGTVYIKETGSISTGKTFDYGINGHSFPAGAYVTVDGNIVTATFACRGDNI